MIVGLLALPALCLPSGTGGCAEHISRPDLLAQIDSITAPRGVDVRSAAEYVEARVPRAIHLSFHSLLFNLDSLSAVSVREESQPLALYCEHGRRPIVDGGCRAGALHGRAYDSLETRRSPNGNGSREFKLEMR